jgi:hypothetical protein
MNQESWKSPTNVGKHKQVLSLNNFEDVLALWAELNEQIATSETQKLLKRLKNDDYPDYRDASVCIAVARWRSDATLKALEQEEPEEDAYISLHDMLSCLKWTTVINPYAEREAIRLYRWYWVISDKYRSKTLDVLMNQWLFETEVAKTDIQAYQLFRSRLTQ